MGGHVLLARLVNPQTRLAVELQRHAVVGSAGNWRTGKPSRCRGCRTVTSVTLTSTDFCFAITAPSSWRCFSSLNLGRWMAAYFLSHVEAISSQAT